MNKSKIILVGPTCSGKNYLKSKYLKRGFIGDVSYTTRDPRPGEKDGRDYHFLSKEMFDKKIENNEFYEWVEYDGTCYGTGQFEWETSDIFIMETNAVSKLKISDRDSSFVLFLNPSRMVREARMRDERKWPQKKVIARARADFNRFDGFKDYDMVVVNSEF